ncbi:MAG: GAF domain-containing protein [bacterium]|nr:GAF domain-containing protein [bacterium]
MRSIYISLIPGPNGFEHRPPTRNELLGSRVALLAGSLDEAVSLLEEFRESVTGIVITIGEVFSHTLIGAELWHLVVPEVMLSNLGETATCFLDMMAHEPASLKQKSLENEPGHSKNIRRQSRDSSGMKAISGIAGSAEAGETLPEANDELRANKHLMQLVMGNIPQFIFWKDLDSVYFGCNQNFAEVAGVGTPGQITGKTDYDLPWKKEEADFFRECDRRVMDTNTPEYHIIEPQHHADGKQAWLDTNKIPLRNKQGKVIGILGTYEDITERIQAENHLSLTESRLEALVTLGKKSSGSLKDITDFALEEAVRLTSSDIGYIAFTNDDESVLTMHNWSKAAMESCLLADKPIVYPIGETGLWGEAVRQRKPVITNDYTADNPLKRGFPEGHIPIKRHVNIPLFDGEKIVAVAGVGNKEQEYDQTDVRQLTLLMQGVWQHIKIRQAAEELERHHEHLEELVKERTKELEEQKERAEIANKAKSEFLANMSHELRTPLNAVIGFSELLSSIAADSKQKSYTQSIKVAGKSLLTLINDILDLSKIEAGMLEIKPGVVRIKSVIDEIQQIFKPTARKKGVEFHVHIDDNVPAAFVLDEVRIRQILLNLVGNAEKFTKKGYIKLSVTSQYNQKDDSKIQLAIAVEDTGIGIAPEAIDIIFESFKQHDGLDTRTYGGTGLGLTICKKLTQAMGGRIGVKSTPGKGSIFEINLNDVPVAIYNETSNHPHLSCNLENTYFNEAAILVVDDIESNLAVIKEVLTKLGFKVTTAENGKIAIDMIAKNQPDFVFMDIKMPVMDGNEATRLIKKNPATQHIPVVAITASSSAENRETIMKNGFDEFMSKPFKVEELLSVLSHYFKTIKIKHEEPVEIFAGIDFKKVKEPIKLMSILNNEILYSCKALKTTMVMSKIKKFGESIETIAKTHQVEALFGPAKNIIAYVDVFDIHAIEEELDRLVDGIGKINILWKDFNGN